MNLQYDRRDTGFQPRKRGLDRALDRGLVGLSLPPCKGAAVIFYEKRIAGHAFPLTQEKRKGNHGQVGLRHALAGRNTASIQRGACKPWR